MGEIRCTSEEMSLAIKAYRQLIREQHEKIANLVKDNLELKNENTVLRERAEAAEAIAQKVMSRCDGNQ